MCQVSKFWLGTSLGSDSITVQRGGILWHYSSSTPLAIMSPPQIAVGLSCITILVIINLHLVQTTSRGPSCSRCHTGPPTDRQVLERYHVEKFKRELLDKLGLDEAPVVARLHQPLPQHLLDYIERLNARGHVAPHLHSDSDQKLIALSRTATDCSVRTNSTCHRFQLPVVTGQTSVTETQLWLSGVQPQVAIRIAVHIENHGAVNDNTVSTTYARLIPERDQFSINVSGLIPRRVDSPGTSVLVSVQCHVIDNDNSSCFTGPLEPYMTLQTHSATVRQRRSTSDSCQRSQSCCRHSLEVVFHQVGMQFVITPDKIDIGYCAGECEEYEPDTRGSLVNQRVSRNWSVGAPCCVPEQYSYVSLLIDIGNGVYQQQNVKLIAADCKCR